jgi:hypothetical protein
LLLCVHNNSHSYFPSIFEGLCAVMSNNAPKASTGMQKFRDEKLASDITNIHRALVLDVEVKQVPEATFVKEILPILTGEVVSAEFPLLMAAVAGTPFSEFDVISEAGEVLFRMPALLERNIISHEEAERRGSMSSMLITAEMLSKQSPRRAENYLQHEFNGRGIAKNRDELYKARHERLNAIMARYGWVLHPNGTVESGAPTTPGPTGSGNSSAVKAKPQLDFDDGELL